MNTRKPLRFEGFNVGAVASAVLLAMGIQSVVATVKEPIAAALIAFWNWTLRTVSADTGPIQPVFISWTLMAYMAVSSIVALAIGVRLAAWVSKDPRPPR